MANPYFKFKKFIVYHDRCAMKVGTDGVLLGAWAHVAGAKSILDIGCGTGLLALMAAQRNPEAHVVGVEIVPEAAGQAAENVEASPWHGRVEVVAADIRMYRPEGLFDAILANPPYFSRSLKCPEEGRAKARHTDTLDYRELAGQASRLLAGQGEFSVVLPTDTMDELLASASSCGLYLSRQTWVHTTPGAIPKRVLLAFRKQAVPVETDELTIEISRHVYTDEYVSLTRAFYLHM